MSVREFFDGWDLYDRVIRFDYMYHRAIHEALGRRLDACPDGPLLDVGCGDAAVIAQTMAASGRSLYEGIDLSPVALRAARENLDAAGLRARLHEADFRTYAASAPDAVFAVVVAGYTVHHLDGDARADFLGDVRRMLLPGGALLLYDVFRGEAEGRDDHLARAQAWRRAEWTRMSPDDLDAIWEHVSASDYPASPREFSAAVERAGFAGAPDLLYESPPGFHRLYSVSA